MANTKRNRKVHAAGILLSLCALGGIAAAAPNVIFSPDAVITASASFDIGDFSVVENETDKTVTVLSYHGTGGAITLPVHTGKYKPANGYTYIVGEDAFNGNKNITSVSFPSCYTIVEDEAFNACTNLKTVSLNEGLKEIRYCGFWHTGLTSVAIPKTVELIGSGAFQSCSSLTSVSRLNGASYSASSLKQIGNSSFASCPKLTSVVIQSNKLNKMGTGVFQNCTALTSLDLDYTQLTEIPYRTFYDCTALTRVYLPQTAVKIRNEAFGNVGTANSKSDHSVEIISLSTTPAINTSTGLAKTYMTCIDSSGNETNWGVAFAGAKKIIFSAYPNSALDYGYHSTYKNINGKKTIGKNASGTSSGITSTFTYFSSSSSSSGSPQVSYWDGDSTGLNRVCTFLKDIPYPLPGKINDNDTIKVNTGYENMIDIVSVTCKDAKTNEVLADGKPFGQGTTYYYEVKIQPKNEYNFNLENMKLSNTSKLKALGEPDLASVATTSVAYTNIVGISLTSAKAKPIVTVRCYADFSDYYYKDSNNETIFPYRESYSGNNISIAPKDLYGAATHTLYYLRAPHPYVDDTTAVNTKPRVTLDLEPVTGEVNKGNLFDQSKYWSAGAASVYYAYREKGTSTALNYRSTWTLENLEPEKTYYVYFSSGASDAGRFYTYEFQAPTVLKVKGANLNLSDVLRLKFNLEPTASFITNDAKATFKVKHGNSYANVTSEIPATNNDGVYAFSVPLNAKEMYDPVTLNGYSASGLSEDWALVLGKKCSYLPDKTFTYTIMEYLNSAVSNPSITPKNRALAQATKDYGIMVMKRLNYNTSLITSADETAALENISDVTAYDFEQFAPVKSGSTPAGFKGVGASFECKSASVFNVKFNVLAGHTIDEFTIKCTDPKGRTTTITPVLSADTENQYVYSITGLTAKQLSDQYTFTVSGGGKTFTIKVSSMSYFYAQRNNSDPNVTNLGKAVYLYNQAANA